MHESTHSLSDHQVAHWSPLRNITCPCVFGKNLTERWGARVTLILAATLASSLLKYWMSPEPKVETFSICFFHALIYCTCIGLEFFYSFHLFSERITRQLFPLNWFLLSLTVLVSAVIGTLTGDFILGCFHGITLNEYMKNMMAGMRFSLILSMIFGISFFLYESLKVQLQQTSLELSNKQLEEERARKQALSAQLSSLESRVRPHFLFNTLNSISALIPEDAAGAERMVERLASLLRFSLDSNQSATIALRDESKILRDYLEIEQVRFGQRLKFAIEIPPDLYDFQVPPFSLQTLAENCVKYCVSATREGGEILIRTIQDKGFIKLEVLDNGCGFTPDQIIEGHGLDNLQARLQTLYEDRAKLSISRENNFTIVSISLPESSEVLR